MEVVEALIKKYAATPYMAKKVEAHLLHLPVLFANIEQEWTERTANKKRLTEEMNSLVKRFSEKYSIYYVPHTSTFLYYANHTIKTISEEDVRHVIFNFIHAEAPAFPLKYKLRRFVLRKIRERSLWSAEPTTATKEDITATFYPAFFDSPVLADYFLTALGDILNGKRDLVYFLHPNYRDMIDRIDDALSSIGRSVSERFKFKYYDHEFHLCRVIPGETSVVKKLRVNGYDLAMVASSLSKWNGSADGYLLQCGDEATMHKAMKMKLYSKDDIVARFFAEFTVPDGSTNMKTMYFLWKTYLHRHSLPAVISKAGLKEWATTHGICDPKSETFKVTPRDSSAHVNLATFWGEHMKPRPGETYEVAEFAALYNNWCDAALECSADDCKQWLNKTYPGELEGDQLRNYVCDLWDKSVDLEYLLETAVPGMGPDELYKDYTQRELSMFVSASYFKKYLSEK